MTTPLLQTPLAAWHRDNGAKSAPFAGWEMPIQYPTGIIAEHTHTREKAGLFDICHMGEYIVEGKGAEEGLSRALSANLANLKVGRCRYGFLLTEQGGIMDDLIVYRLGEERFYVVVNAGCRHSDLAAIRERVPAGVHVEDVSDATGKLDLQGPMAFDVLDNVLPGVNWRALPYFGLTEEGRFDGAPILVSRTGYTGELGVEIYCPWDKTEKLWTELLKDERVKPVGLGARDTLRLEVGLPLNGQDLDPQHTPGEAGYSGMLTSEADFVGKAHAFTVRERLVPMRIDGRRSARHGDLVLLNGEEVGVVTSGSYGPTVAHSMALAYIKAGKDEAAAYTIKAAKAELNGVVVPLPFYSGGTARAKLV